MRRRHYENIGRQKRKCTERRTRSDDYSKKPPPTQAEWTDKNNKGRWRAYDYEELIMRDKITLGIFWLKDEALEDRANLPAPKHRGRSWSLKPRSPNSPKLPTT